MIHCIYSYVRISGVKLVRLALLCCLELWAFWPSVWLIWLVKLFLQKPRWLALEPWPWGGFCLLCLSWLLPWLRKLALWRWFAWSGTKSELLFNWKLDCSNDYVDCSLLESCFLDFWWDLELVSWTDLSLFKWAYSSKLVMTHLVNSFRSIWSLIWASPYIDRECTSWREACFSVVSLCILARPIKVYFKTCTGKRLSPSRFRFIKFNRMLSMMSSSRTWCSLFNVFPTSISPCDGRSSYALAKSRLVSSKPSFLTQVSRTTLEPILTFLPTEDPSWSLSSLIEEFSSLLKSS